MKDQTQRGIRPHNAKARDVLHVTVSGSRRGLIIDVVHTPERERWWLKLSPETAERLARQILSRLGVDPDKAVRR